MNKILIVQTAFIGDVVLASPLIDAVKTEYPAAVIKFLTIPYSAPVLENLPYLDDIIIFDKRGKDKFKQTFQIVQRLKSEKFDLAVVPHRSIRSAMMVYFAGIPVRIGFDRSAGSFLFTRKIKYRKDFHEVERNLSLLDIDNTREYHPAIYPGKQDDATVERLLSEFEISGDYICVAPGSIWETKRWTTENFTGLIDLIHKNNLGEIILAGAPSEKLLCQEIADSVESPVKIAAGRLTPLESAVLFKKSKAVIANDSAAGHIAAAVGRKVVSIFGPSVPAFGFTPFGEGHQVAEHPDLYCRPCRIHGSRKCPEKHFRCMKELIPEMVLEKLILILNNQQ